VTYEQMPVTVVWIMYKPGVVVVMLLDDGRRRIGFSLLGASAFGGLAGGFPLGRLGGLSIGRGL
jgi:hypothetical protein